MTADYKPYPTGFYHIYSIKSLTYLHNSFIRQGSLYIVKLTNVLDLAFPKFMSFFLNRFSKTAFSILANYYHKKRQEEKPHRVILFHLSKKLLQIIYTLETKDMGLYESK